MAEKKKPDLPTRKDFTKSLALIQKSQRSLSFNQRHVGTHVPTVTGLLTEFLTSIMTKDYEQALMYCTEILCAEPKNTTAREFYPLIIEKLEMMENDDSSDLSTTSNSSLSSSSSENMFFNKTTGIALKKSEDSLQQISEKCNLEEKKIAKVHKNVTVSSSLPLGKTFKGKSTHILEYGGFYGKQIVAESSLTESNYSNLLVHPTPTITLVQNTDPETKVETESCSHPKEQDETKNSAGKKCSHVLLHMSPTITISKKPPSEEAVTENPK